MASFSHHADCTCYHRRSFATLHRRLGTTRRATGFRLRGTAASRGGCYPQNNAADEPYALFCAAQLVADGIAYIKIS